MESSSQKNVLKIVPLILLKSTSRLSWNRRVTVCYEDIVDVIWRKPVLTYAISACEALMASVNSVYNVQCTEPCSGLLLVSVS